MRVYECHNYLANYFQSTGDKWLSDHFYENCLQYSASVVNDNGKVAAEGHCNVGICLEEAGYAFHFLLHSRFLKYCYPDKHLMQGLRKTGSEGQLDP